MNKERFEWVMSGLNQHALTKTEDQFVKTVLEEFGKKQVLTELQEERLESLYREKSKLTPNKNSSNYFSFKESSPKKSRPQKSRAKWCFDVER